MKKIVFFAIFIILNLNSCGVNEEEYLKFHNSGITDAVGMTQANCLATSIAKIRNCDGMDCSVNVNGYFLGCFENASKSPEVCEGVPVWNGGLQDGGWRESRCIAASADPVRCDILFASLQRQCH